jgi:hypothetical protein
LSPPVLENWRHSLERRQIPSSPNKHKVLSNVYWLFPLLGELLWDSAS